MANALQSSAGRRFCAHQKGCWGVTELQNPREQCWGERNSRICPIPVATAAKERCLWKHTLGVPHYLDSELEEIALNLRLIWFTG